MTTYVREETSLNPREIKTVAANTTLTNADGQVNVNGTYTITLPQISTLSSLGNSDKDFVIKNVGTGIVTVTPDTTSPDYIGPSGATSWTLNATNDVIVIESNRQSNTWEITNIAPFIPSADHIADDILTGAKLTIGKHYSIKVVETNGTTAVDVFSSAGAPAALTITGVMAVAKDTVANTEVVLTNGTLAVATFDKLNTVGWVIAEETDMTNETVTSGDTLTVVTDTTGNAQVWITFESV